MKLTKKIEKEIKDLMEDYWNLYLTGKIEPWSKYLVDNYRNIGGTEEEIWDSKKEILDYTYGVIDQMVDQVQLRNKTIQIIPYDPYFMVHELLDMYVKVDNEWSFYGKFRLSTLIKKFGTDWKILHQHGSFPDSKTQKGEAFAADALKSENIKLQKAVQKRTAELEQKNRELEIEGALDRIRAQAVAMKETSDLLDIVVTMRNEFIKLGHEAHYFWHMMWLPDTYEKAMTSGDGTKIGFVMKLPRHIHGDIPLLAKWEKSKKQTVVHAMNVEDALDYIHKMVTLGDFQNIDPQAPTEDDIRHIGGLTFVMARTSHGEIGYSLPGIVKNPPKEDIDILVKFASAFDLAHQRFLDLQKAERQAKETLMELSLERIRSRVTSMQKSSDLFNIVVAMRKEFISLGHQADYFWHMQWLEDNYEMSMTSEDGNRIGMIITVPKFVHEEIPTLANWEKGLEPTCVLPLDAEAAWNYIEKMNTYGQYKQADPNAPTKEDIEHIGGLTFIMARTTHGEIGYSLAGVIENPPKGALDILERFAGAFDLAYQRFLDLQKAEAQARETQIELALEKVRSRTMAMQRSEELADVSSVLFQQVKELGIEQWTCGFNIWETGDTEFKYFPGGPDGKMLPSCMVPLMEHPVFREFVESRKRGDDLMVYEKEGDIQKDHYKYMLSLPGIGDMLQGVLDQGMEFPDFQIDHIANFAYGNIVFITYEPVPKMHNVFKRFAKVFEQTYTRFLDLQKAEAQAKEAQIETALEKVRSRSMAMHNSDEIGDVAFVLFQQLKSLGGEFWGTGFGFCKHDSKVDEFWFANEKGIMPHLKIPNTKDLAHKKMYQGWKKNLELFSIAQDGKELKEHYKYMLTVPDVQPIFQGMLDDGITFPKWQKWHAAYFKYGYLLAITTEPYENEEIFVRFAKVFEQAYTRFLDLQKAEAQARESQIEAALERVRSQSMGMQTSEDLSLVTTAMFEQLRLLGGDLFATGIVFCDKHKDHVEQWHSIPEAGMLSPFIVPTDLDYIHQYRYDEWKKGTDLFSVEIPSDFIQQHFQDIFNLPSAQKVLQDFEDQNTPMPGAPPWEIDYGASFKHGYLLVSSLQPFEEAEILPRFAKVFEQTYTRFLDLQKAEAQAREAQIETALEKVRSRTMAMQKGIELQDVVVLLYKELIELGVTNFASCGYVEVNEKISRQLTWVTNPGGDSLGLFYLPLTGDVHFDTRYDAWKKQQSVFHQTVAGKERRKHLEYAITTFQSKEAEEMVLNQFPDPCVFYCFNFSHGYLHLVGGSLLTNEEETLLARFTKVFEQTYARFLDLQKAEAQAREAQIEAALERVRSRSMAMHNSEELKEVIQVLYEQFVNLNINIEHAGFILDYKENDDMHIWLADEHAVFPEITLPYFDCAHWNSFNEAKKKGQNFFTNLLGFEEKNKFYKDLFEFLPELPEETKTTYYKFDGLAISTVLLDSIGLYIENYSGIPFSDEENAILMRFGKVFQQTYTRFLDLQKAEAQARESEIELALERVRSRSMAMQKSSELLEAAELLWNEITKLGIENITSGFVLMEKDEKLGWNYMPNPSTGKIVPEAIGVYHDKTDIMRSITKNWKKQKPLFVVEMNEEQTITHQTFIAEQSINFHITAEQLIDASPPELKLHNFNFKQGYLLIVGGTRLTFEQDEIMLRFTKVFQQTYTRFLDLQKAEAQTREAKIEIALEKVRSRTMAMQHSKELPEAAKVLSSEVQNLGIPAWSCGYNILSEDKKSSTCIMSSEGEIQSPFILPLTKHKSLKPWHKTILKNEDFFVYEQGGNDLVEHYHYMESLPELKETFQQFKDADISLPTFQVNHLAKFTNGFLLFITYERVPEAHDIFQRFAKVFNQTYTRFLDLQKAEAQTRTAQINLAVERVRAKALAMHKSEEIIEVVAKLKDEVMGLDIPDVVAATIFLNEGDDKVRMWDLSSLEDDDNYSEVPFDVTFKIKKTDPHLYVKRVWENPENYFVEIQDEKDLKRLMQWLREQHKNEIADEVEDFTEKIQLKRLYHAAKKLNNGKLVIDQLNPPSEEMETILTKMGGAFDLAYKRFEDLQKAEAQAREALIEAALEKVRSRSLAMHKPDELQEVVTVVAEKLKELGVILDAGGAIICTYFPDNKDVMHWISAPDFSHSGSYFIPYFDDKTFNEAWDSKNRGDSYFSQAYPLEDKNKFFEYAFEHSDYRNFPDDFKQLILQSTEFALSFAWQKNSAILIPSHSGIIPSKSDAEIIKRFSKVFEQAYIRFMDLQKAEEQAKEAQIEASLERVRSRTLAMQNSEELAQTSVVVFQQLLELGIAPNRLFIGIIKDEGTSLEAWATNEDGSKLGSHFSLQASKNKSIKKMLTGWKQHKKSLVIDMKGKELKDYFHYLNEEMDIPFIHGLEQKRRVQTIAYFSGGLIGMAAPDEQPQETIKLLERFAAVFNLTYTRFNDLKVSEAQTKKAEEDLIKLQAAKKSAEDALSELQTTQTQLIQSEKMASLGELTAGIAHEIQNPLNFVNNFSEVSKELLDEMIEELENGDMEEVRAITDDVIQNLEKINHHGKRADGIVKGMLQHSRSSTGTKEPTDINALGDEYLRLAYHGLRAKDKSFNATLVTDFDDTIGNINIIPQDIGRVVLNLLTNAFYVVNEKKQQNTDGYKPTVSLTTKKNGNLVTISVKDNGNGIPKKVVDKIFQPFFTTKPTGEGTGLGLSMSYDIVTKGHGGELKVNTVQNKGTEFIIILPI